MSATSDKRSRSGLDLAINAVVALSIAILLAALILNQFFATKVPFMLIRGLQYAGWAGVALYLLMIAFQNRGALADLARHRRTASGGNSLLQAIIFLAIIGALDFLSTRHHWRWDVTSNHRYSLSQQTKKILAGLKSDVHVTAFIVPNNYSSQQADDLLKEYTYASPHFKLTRIDPERDPIRARQLIQKYGLAKNGYFQNNTIVFDDQGRTTTLTGFTEQDFTSGLLKVTSPHQKVVYFLAGHGESDPTSFAPTGMGQLQSALKNQQYAVKELNLFSQASPKVPADAAVVVVAAPEHPIGAKELDALSAYVKTGGKVMVMLDPTFPHVGMGKWLSAYGVTPDADLVVDLKKNLWGNPEAVAAIKSSYQFHTITQSFTNASIATFFPQTGSLSVASKLPAGVSVTPLIQTSDDSWGLTQPGTRSQIDPSKDLKGPLKLAVAVTVAVPAASTSAKLPAPASSGPKEGRLVVYSDAQFAQNVLTQRAPSDQDLALASLNWLTADNALISIPPKQNQPRTVDLLGSKATTIAYASLGSPLVLFLIGGLVWWRRR